MSRVSFKDKLKREYPYLSNWIEEKWREYSFVGRDETGQPYTALETVASMDELRNVATSKLKQHEGDTTLPFRLKKALGKSKLCTGDIFDVFELIFRTEIKISN